MYFIFRPHLTSASVLPGETGNLEIASFHLNAACFFTKKTRNTGVLGQAWSKSQWTLLMGYLTTSTMLDAIKHITDDNFFFRGDSAQVHYVCNTIQLSDVIFVFPRFAR